MNATDRTIRKFNPGTFQSDEEVIAQFVVRKRELGTVIETLRGNIESPSCQHMLVVAPRGRGKTMLLARTAAEIRTDEELSARMLPVRFMEESQEIFNIADFWLETLFHLAGEVAANDAVLARQLRRTHNSLTLRWREENLEEHARSAVLETADRLGRKLVLMVENLQGLTEDVNRDFGWKLRGALQSESQIMLLASATSRFQGLDDAGQPFFELFRMVGLQPLTTQECRRLWQVVSGDLVSGREIRPLEILTGGSPRLLVIVSGFAQHRSIRQLMEELVALIDDHTEYFRGHLDVLAKTERRVYLAVLDLWQPSKTGEIAARARMDVRTVSTMLGRLVNRGALVVDGVGRKRLYSAAERLFCIYYKLRRERDEAAIIQNLIRFMAVFYSKTELAEMSGMLIWEVAESKDIRKGIEQALYKVSEVGSDTSSTAWPVFKRILSQGSAIAAMKSENDFDYRRSESQFDRLIEMVDRGRITQKSGLPPAMVANVGWALLETGAGRERIGSIEGAIEAYKIVMDRFGGSDETAFQAVFAVALSAMARLRVKNDEIGDAIASYGEIVDRFGGSNELPLKLCVAMALIDMGNVREKVGELESAIAAYEDVVERCGGDDVPEIQERVAFALTAIGRTRGELGEIEGAISTLNEVATRFDSSSEGRLQWCVAKALVHKGDIQIEINRAEEALQTCDELELRLGTFVTGDEAVELRWQANCIRIGALLIQGRLRGAMKAFSSAYETFAPRDELMMRGVLGLVLALVAAGVPEQDLVEILSSDRTKSDALAPLVVALRQRAGDVVRAPAEILEVAADIRNHIEKASANGNSSAS